MTTFRVSQAETWARTFIIEADSFEEAKAKYEKYVETGEETEDIIALDPDYVDDIQDDVVWMDSDSHILEI